MFVLTRPVVDPFTGRQIELIETFADQAVIAIENARLFEEVQARTSELTKSLEDLQAAQGRLVQTEKLASLGQLTAGIAHEIKNPLNFVNNFSALSVELIDELEDALEVLNPTHRCNRMLPNSWACSRATWRKSFNTANVPTRSSRTCCCIPGGIRRTSSRRYQCRGRGEPQPCLSWRRAEKQGFNITIEKNLDPDAGEIDIYPQEITRVLINLASNAFFATAKRGAQSDGGHYEPILTAATKNLGGSVEIRIRDNGTGIPRAVQEKMFDPFFTTKPAGEGTGSGCQSVMTSS